MRWLGIDPGLRTTGFGVIEIAGQRLTYIASGTIESGEASAGLPKRLGLLYEGVREIVVHYSPNAAAIEEIFLNVNPRSTLLLGQARGAAIAALVSTQIEVAEFSTRSVKKSVVGTGGATKTQVQEMVKRLLNLKKMPGADAADALAVAICAAHTQGQNPLLQLSRRKALR
ncbi:MAG: crossover junction endodeoxyribonuclease RuvC [Polynucleobacter sp.]|jgi:crossover junction endodeoxyribonuclease RuvC|nr:crossover junction endodeoxyribonuclease RuvC [Polynucleobacter sp.]